MKIKKPEPFTFEAGPRAVLLLHGFTGNSADVRMLGRFLERQGYTSHAPIYRGHGLPPEELTKANATQWWEDVLQAYTHLEELGYKEIAVAGLSLGGVLGLRLAYSKKVKGVIPMCAPMFFDNKTQLTKGFRFFAKEYKELEGKEAAVISEEVDQLMDHSEEMFQEIADTISQVKENVELIYAPSMVVQAKNDEMINMDSAAYIYDNIQSDSKAIKWYDAPHVITLSNAKQALHEDIHMFLESLDWEQ
ncbi:alpha/beta hydrolase [Virgibacillus halophilus]|uniref:Alpha/beta fold hydrolase n=1 Tax=Tigheibacillus halophilus TaxID=361280 RepID=A0ABU5CBL6_9BACI|nr:alpha/beta fold hydrolase [Virgibacillus halophilus]